MPDAPTPNAELVTRFAALLALAADATAPLPELRALAKQVVDAARAGGVTFGFDGGAFQADRAPCDAAIIGERMQAYGVEELGITPKSSQADLLDLARLLASPPGDGDPVARFSSRAAVIDSRTIPRRLRARRDPQVEVPLVPTPPARPSMKTPSRTPAMTRAVTPPTTPAVDASPSPSADASPAAAGGTGEHATDPATAPGTAPARRTPRAIKAPSTDSAPAEPRDAPVRLLKPLAVPEPKHPALESAMRLLTHADETKRRTQALEQMVTFCDLAFRQGRHDDLIEGVAALLAIEYRELERDGADEQRQAYNHAVRRLARPVLLRQLATLRQTRAGDALAVERLDMALYRFGIDGAEAVIDACANAPDLPALESLLQCLRGLPRAHEALRAQLKDADEHLVRSAIAVLGALRDRQAEAALDGLLEHPDSRTRRDVVTALARFEGEGTAESVAFALGDESPTVRLRAVNGLAARREPRLLALLDPILKGEAEREVLYAAIDALAKLGTPDAVNVLIQVAQGQGSNPQRDSSGLRIQALLGLVAIRSPIAMAAVQGLRQDRDREVRQASMRLVAHAKRRPTTQTNAIIAP